MIPNATFSAALKSAEERYAGARPRSHSAFDQAQRSMPGGNTRSVLYFPPFPFFVQRSMGCRLLDIDGHEYVDFLGEYTAGLAGHDHPAIRAAIAGVLERGWVNGAQHEGEALLAEAICRRFPSIERVRFCNSGTEANLLALTTARVTTGREAIMAFRGAYHGGVLLFKDGPSPQNAPFETVMGFYNDPSRTQEIIRAHASRLAAVIVEPMLGAGGCIPADAEFLKMLRQECTAHGIVLIFDEVMTSRLAVGGVQERVGVLPDITTLGKYIGGGLSFGAFGGRAEILDRYDPRRRNALSHAGTFNNNPFTMAAGAAVMNEVFTDDVVAPFNQRGDDLRRRLQVEAEARSIPLRLTGCGSMMCIHVAADPIDKPEQIPDSPEIAAARGLVHLELIERGQYLARRGMIVLSLPMSDEEHDGLTQAFADVVSTLAPLFARLHLPVA